MKFEQAVNFILQFEGGYVFDSNDPGGETHFGISKRSYPNLDIKNLLIEAAINIYRKDYWLLLRIDEMPAPIRLMVFDCAVNQGVHRAIRMLQGAIGVKQDGVMGIMTLMAFRETPIGLIMQNMALLRHQAYAQNPHWHRFGAGWSKRLLQVVLESVEII